MGLFLAMLAFYLLGGSREELWGDPKAAYKAAERWVVDDEVDIKYAWPIGSEPAPDGKFYSPYPALASLVHVPAAKFQKNIKEDHPELLPLTGPLAGHLASAIAGALTCLLFFRLCSLLGVSPGVAGATTIILGTATLVWFYARDPFAEIVQTACFTGLVGALLRVATSPQKRHALALGVWAGLLLNSKQVFALAMLGAAVYLLVALRRDWKRLLVTGALAAAAFVPFVILAALYNEMRWGSYTDAGLGSNAPLFTERLVYGLLGLVASPGKSIFLYSPPLVVALFGLPLLVREHRAAALAIAATALPVLVLYAKYVLWNGDQSWGPRYLLFLHPVACLPLALLLQRGLRRWQTALVAAIVVVGVGVQIAGGALWRGHWIRIARAVNTAWLGSANASGSVQEPCMACFEHHYGTIWLPPFQSIDGHVWLLRHMAAGDSYAEAEKDAPWRRYTKLHFDVAAHYDRARLDWWVYLWLDDHPELRRTGSWILGAELALLAAGAFLWMRRARGP